MSHLVNEIIRALVFRRSHSVEEASNQDLEELQPSVPVLSGAGAGAFCFWQLGVVQYLGENYDLNKVQLRGASAGALVATLVACGVDPEKALDSAHQLATAAALWDRKLKLAGVWGNLIRIWLRELLPSNAFELVRGRLQIVVTDVKDSFKQVILQDFDSNEELIEANLCSAHVPFFLDWKPFAWFRGRPYVDGSLGDILRGDNSRLLTCAGHAVVLDYFQDEEILSGLSRADFLKLRSHEEARALMQKGYQYAARNAATGEYEQKFGQVRLCRP